MLELKNITRVYQMGDQIIRALDDVSLTINDGEYVAIIGPSGSGKSTLMNVIGCLDNPSSGQYLLNGKDVSRLRDDQLADARNKNIGFVFQRFNLMGRMSALRNVEMPARYGGVGSKQRKQRAVDALVAVGLGDRVNHKPVELSGGQQQRVAIARALVNQPNILLADEPTGALDSKTGRDILDLFERLHRERGITVILVTHDPSVARRANRVISIRDGRIESDLATAHAGDTLVHDHEPMHIPTAVPVREAVLASGRANGASVPVAVAEPAFATTIGNGKHDGTTGTQVAEMNTKKTILSGGDAAQASEMTPTTSQLRLPGIQVLRRGAIAVLIAVVVNVVLGLGLGAVLPLASRLPMFSPVPIALFTLVFGVLGVGVFALLNKVSQKPAAIFRWVAVGALVLSFIPNIAMIANPALLLQLMATQGRPVMVGTGGFAGAPRQGQQNTDNAAGNQTNPQGQGNRGNRVPGLGPLGGAFGGNNVTARAGALGAGGFLSIPMVALMLLHIVAFGIITGVLTRGLGKKSGTTLNTSGLT